jgi:hypothetical protein
MLKGFTHNAATGVTTVHFKPSRRSNTAKRDPKQPRKKNVWRFSTIGVDTLQQWKAADSAGNFFLTNIRPNHTGIAAE